MSIILMPADGESALGSHYRRAFSRSVELYVLSAYLTEWEPPTKLNNRCRRLVVVVGKDFGITRKHACRNLLGWLPASHRSAFLVATRIDGFHPKFLAWRESDGSCHSVIGSSNLTRAAFSKNHEANVYLRINRAEFERVRAWIERISDHCDLVDEDWLNSYVEAPRSPKLSKKAKKARETLLHRLDLPRPRNARNAVEFRRGQLEIHRQQSGAIDRLFRRCSRGGLTSLQFYEALSERWSYDVGNRLQGRGWERLGKRSNFEILARSYVRIIEASPRERDAVVATEIDFLKRRRVQTRTAFLSEMLCLRFPESYPLLNRPIRRYLQAISYRNPRGATQGAAYIALAQHLRRSLQQDDSYPAKNIAELDAVIWTAYPED